MGPPHGGHELLGKFLQVHPRMKGEEQDSNGYVETNFFSSDNYLKGLDWYESSFSCIVSVNWSKVARFALQLVETSKWPFTSLKIGRDPK